VQTRRELKLIHPFRVEESTQAQWTIVERMPLRVIIVPPSDCEPVVPPSDCEPVPLGGSVKARCAVPPSRLSCGLSRHGG
jgi:hypothetical protein